MDQRKDMDIEFIENVKRLSIIAMVSDDDLMDMLVLKGGNAIDIIYRISGRASIDIDFSMETDFKEGTFSTIKSKIEKVLQETFGREGLKAFDITFEKRPEMVRPEVNNFWGGYIIGFKLIPSTTYNEKSSDIDFLRRNAAVVGPEQKRIFTIAISKFEFCKDKTEKEIGDYTVYVYTPEMIVFEKTRAICQHMPEYTKVVKTQQVLPRARDFFDIYIVMEHFKIDLNNRKNKELLKAIFDAKRVPLTFLKNIRKYEDFHREDFSSVQATVKAGVELKDFKFYFDYVVDKFEQITF